jgi:sugar diacid utilization regulator
VDLTLAEVLRQAEFGLVQRCGSPAAWERVVAGAEVVEVDRPVELSAKDHILLTTGVRLRGNPGLQRQLVVESEARGVIAIGVGVGLVFQTTPRALLDEARQRDFPVFEVPLEVPFRDIIGYINRSLLSADFYSLQRAVSVQNTLLGALGESHPEEGLARRLAGIVNGSVVLYRPTGALAARAGDAPHEAIWAELHRRDQQIEEFETDGWRVVTAPIAVDGSLRYWMAMASRHELPTPASPLVEVAERLLRLIELAREVGVVEERVRRSALLDELLDPQRSREVSRERLELFGFRPDAPVRVALVAVSAPASRAPAARRPASVLSEAARLVANAAAGTSHPYLLGQSHQHVALLIQGDDAPVDSWTKGLLASGLEARAAVGRPVSALERVADSRGDALLALDFLLRDSSAGGRVLWFEDFAFIDALLCGADPGILRARSELVLGPLRAHPQLLETLEAYLMSDLNVTEAAGRLHVHPNSVRYRLGRVEEIIGRPVHDLGAVVELYVALRAETRLGESGPL